jgi:hypothetical protein
MMIADVIRHANSEREIYSLLIAYIEAMQFGDKTTFISSSTTMLPLAGKEDLQMRFNQLFLDLDSASKSLDDQACMAMKEALHVFGNALQQLRQLELLNGTQDNSPFVNHHIKKMADQRQIMRTHLDQVHKHSESQASNRKPPIPH